MADKFSAHAYVPENPANGAFAVTPDDNTDLQSTTRGLYVGGFGDVAVVMRDSTTVVFANVSEGTILPVSARRVRATGTTAASIIGLM